MKLEIIDNFLPPEMHRKLYNTMISQEFPWNFCSGVTEPGEMIANKQIFQFVHMFYHRYNWYSNYAEILHPIIEAIDPLAIVRIKANLTTITPNSIKHEYHRDLVQISKAKTACFYVNTNNGRTIFNSGEEIESVANRLVIFDSNDLHAGVTCTDESFKIVINFNYFTKYS